MTRGLATFTVRLSLLCAVLAGLAGCAHFAPHFESPHLSVVGVEVQEASLAGQKFRVRMRVQNPNDRELPVKGIVCALKLAGEDFGEGTSAGGFTVPRQGEADFDMLLATNLAATLWKVLPRLKDSSRPVEYRLTGKVSTALTFLGTIPFDERGTVPMGR